MKHLSPVTEIVPGSKDSTVGFLRQDTRVVSLALDFDPAQEEKWDEFFLGIDVKAPPASLLIKAHVYASQPRKKMRSPNYLATVRRREASRIAKIVRDLPLRADEEHFVAWTHEALGHLRRSVQSLADAEENSYPEQEGNACEILREVRDSFLNGGWQRYADPAVAMAVAGILDNLAEAEEVLAADVEKSIDKLLDLGLEPGAGLACFDEEEVSD